MASIHPISLRAAAILAGAMALSACGERSAEGETPVAEAEVATELPETVISDEQLQATANAAAQVASTPPAQVVVVPGATPNQGAAAGQGNAMATGQPQTTGTQQQNSQ